MEKENEVKKEMKTLGSIQKVWLSGTTLVVAIPRRIREVLEIHKGDYIEVDWGEIIKKSKEEVKKLKKEKKIVVEDDDEDEEDSLPEID